METSMLLYRKTRILCAISVCYCATSFSCFRVADLIDYCPSYTTRLSKPKCSWFYNILNCPLTSSFLILPWSLASKTLVICSPLGITDHHSRSYKTTCKTPLDAFAKLRKAAISFVTSVLPLVRMDQLGSHWTDFHRIWYSSIFRKYVEIIQDSLTSDKNNGYFTWRSIYIFDHISLNTS